MSETPKCGCGAEFTTIGELRSHIDGFYQSARHWEAPMSTDSIMLEVWAQWADKEGNRGAAALFRRVRAALEASKTDTQRLEEISFVAENYVSVDVAHDDPAYAVSIMAQIVDELAAVARSPLTESAR